MNRRSFFRLSLGTVAASALPLPQGAVAEAAVVSAAPVATTAAIGGTAASLGAWLGKKKAEQIALRLETGASIPIVWPSSQNAVD